MSNGHGQDNNVRVHEKRIFICHSKSAFLSAQAWVLNVGAMLDPEPFGFEVNRDGNDGEKLKVLYSRSNDRFFQLQESVNEPSCFVDTQILKETQVFLVTELDPFFLVLPALLNSKN